MVCEHKVIKMTTIEGATLEDKEPYKYMTIQCEDCGYFPNSDFKRNALRENCPICQAFVRTGTLSIVMNKPIPLELLVGYVEHVKRQHPEVNILSENDRTMITSSKDMKEMVTEYWNWKQEKEKEEKK